MSRFLNNKLKSTEDSKFWANIVSEESNQREQERVKKSNSQKGIKVVIDSGEGVAAVGDRKQNCWKTIVPFRGQTIRGYYEKLFSKKEENLLRKEILEQYIGNHKYMTEYQKSRILKKIKRNVDLKMYKVLKDYDISNYGETNGSQEYVNAMIKNIRVKNKKTDSTRQRAKNEDIARRKELKKSGISLTYDLSRLVFNTNNPIDNIKVLANALKYRKFAEVKFFAFTLNPAKRRIRKPRKVESNRAIKIKKKEKQLVPLKLNKTRKQKEYTSKESLIKRFKNKVNEVNWIKVAKRGLVTAGIIGLSGLAGYASVDKKDYETNQNTNKQQIITMENDEISNFDINKPVLETKEFKIVGLSNKEDIKQNPEENNKFNIQKDNSESDVQASNNETNVEISNSESDVQASNSETNVEISNNKPAVEIGTEEDVQKEEKVILQDALIETLGLGFNTEFSMGSGRFYEAPGKTGRSGGYSNISNKIKINYVDAIENGNYYKYSIQDGMSLADIKKAHPNAEFSYHIVTNKGMTLGWNDSTENNIESNLVKAALMELKFYLSSETMEYLCANDLNGKISSAEFAEYVDELQEAQAKLQESKSLGNFVNER